MISIIHPSARPEKALETWRKWMASASCLHGSSLHYVVCFDYGVDPPEFPCEFWTGGYDSYEGEKVFAKPQVVVNYGRKCSVDATNVAATYARLYSPQDFMIVISDDVSPCDGWQRLIPYSFKPCVTAVDTMDQEDPTHTLTVQILNRARYEQLGYIFHPDYTSMYADDEFTEHAKRDGVLVEALHIKMKHERFERDEVYERQQGDARFAWGKALLEHRRKHGFPRVTPGLASMRECVNLWNLGEGRVTGDVEKAISQLDAYENV